MLRFIYGCPGSGKSTFLTNEITENLRRGKKAILLVPERFAVSSEQRVTAVGGERNRMNLEFLSSGSATGCSGNMAAYAITMPVKGAKP